MKVRFRNIYEAVECSDNPEMLYLPYFGANINREEFEIIQEPEEEK